MMNEPKPQALRSALFSLFSLFSLGSLCVSCASDAPNAAQLLHIRLELVLFRQVDDERHRATEAGDVVDRERVAAGEEPARLDPVGVSKRALRFRFSAAGSCQGVSQSNQKRLEWSRCPFGAGHLSGF